MCFKAKNLDSATKSPSSFSLSRNNDKDILFATYSQQGYPIHPRKKIAMHILVTGASGFIGSAFIENYKNKYAITAVSRKPDQAHIMGVQTITWDALQSLDDYDVVINLAGENIAAKKWSKKQKNLIRDSRINAIKKLHFLYQNSIKKPTLFIQASAIGYYGTNKEKASEETLVNSADFPHKLCVDIEKESSVFTTKNTRLCILRIGVVLGKNGGILKKIAPTFNIGLGGRIGDGQHIISWIHITDLTRAIDYVITTPPAKGIYNITSPAPVSANQFYHTFATILNRPYLCHLPPWLIRFIFGEMSILLTKGQYVIPKRLITAEFKFKYPDIKNALIKIYK